MKNVLCLVAVIFATAMPAIAQQQLDAKVDLPFNRFYDFPELEAAMAKLAEAHPELATLVSLGQSEQGREMWLMVINNPATGPDTYTGFLVSTLNGSTETTFYVLAVYFGSVGVHRIRHGLATALTADLAGIVGTVVACQLYFAWAA